MRTFTIVIISFLFAMQTIATAVINHKMRSTMTLQARVIEHQKAVIQRQYQYLLSTHCSVKCYNCGPAEMEQ